MALTRFTTVVLFAAAFTLLGLLHSARVFEEQYRAGARPDRLIVNSLQEPLPLSEGDRIAKIPNVASITAQALIVGQFDNPPKSTFIVLTDEGYFSFYPEFKVTPAQIQTLRNTPNGFIATQALVDLNRWKIGDTISLQSNITKEDSSQDWKFSLVAIVDRAERPRSDKIAIGNYAYVNEARATGKNFANRFLVRVRDPAEAEATSKAIDATFPPGATLTVAEGLAVEKGQLGRVPFPLKISIVAVALVLMFLTIGITTRKIGQRESVLLSYLPWGPFVEIGTQAAIGDFFGLVLARGIIPAINGVNTGHLFLASYPLSDAIVGVGIAIFMAAGAVAISAWRLRPTGQQP